MPKEKNYGGTLTVRLPEEMVKQAKLEARRLHRPLSEILRDLVRAWLERRTWAA
jgi:Arc/MetJ-type ribon-helix-helix transcriptional regulator